jgi:hypothetical protein
LRLPGRRFGSHAKTGHQAGPVLLSAKAEASRAVAGYEKSNKHHWGGEWRDVITLYALGTTPPVACAAVRLAAALAWSQLGGHDQMQRFVAEGAAVRCRAWPRIPGVRGGGRTDSSPANSSDSPCVAGRGGRGLTTPANRSDERGRFGVWRRSVKVWAPRQLGRERGSSRRGPMRQ